MYLTQEDLAKAGLPDDPFWWTNGQHVQAFAIFEARCIEHDSEMDVGECIGEYCDSLPLMIEAYCDSMPLDNYAKCNIAEYLSETLFETLEA